MVLKFGLKKEQERAFWIVANHSVSAHKDQLNMYLGGMGGTGKSQVLAALSDFFALQKEAHQFVIVAPTGSAAALLGGSTYHSMFGINDFNSKSQLSQVKANLAGIEYVLSMLSARDLYHISNQLWKVYNTPEESFGGINMVLEILHNYLQQLVVKGYHFTHNQLELSQVVWNPRKKQLESTMALSNCCDIKAKYETKKSERFG